MSKSEATQSSTNRNLTRLCYLRSLVVAAELLAIFGVRALSDIEMPLIPLLTIIGLMVVVNFWTWRRAQSDIEVTEFELLCQLIFDVLVLTAILYFTGGASNPVAWFYLIPLMIGATLLSKWATWLLASIAIAGYSLLMFHFSVIDEESHMSHNVGFNQHVIGMWFGFVFTAVLVAWVVVGMANSLRTRDRALAAARERALRDEQLIALGTLATGAAHELGTPLATMAVVAGELERHEALPDAIKRKVEILHSQIGRCKKALSVISASAGETQAESGSVVGVNNFLEQTISLWESQRTNIKLAVEIQSTGIDAQILNERTLQQSIINILNNAADASPDGLVFKAHWDDQVLELVILDRGMGVYADKNDAIGKLQQSKKEYGMGLGLFLTHATMQRLGGDIELFDREGGGTCTKIQLPILRKGIT